MAEETAPQLPENGSEITNPATEDMDLETLEPGLEPKGLSGGSEANKAGPVTDGDANSKRDREGESADEDSVAPKKLKVEKSVEEERLGKVGGDGEGKKGPAPVRLGPKSFGSSVEMFDYFFKFLRYWAPELNVNKYEHMVLLELLKKGHVESDKKIGCGIRAFQIRYHPEWKSKCFFLIREDGSVDDFSFRKCVDHILPLPENMKVKSDANKALGGGNKHRGGRSGGRRGRGGRSKN